MMKIYTKTGDGGETGLYGGERVSKNSARVDAYGEVDELNSVIGCMRSELERHADSDVRKMAEQLELVQMELFSVGAELSNPKEKDLKIKLVTQTEIERFERDIDAWELELAPLKNFVLPGGTAAASWCHLSRTVCRRAERRVVGLYQEHGVRIEIIQYLNRLSDWCFVAARWVNKKSNKADTLWNS